MPEYIWQVSQVCIAFLVDSEEHVDNYAVVTPNKRRTNFDPRDEYLVCEAPV